MASYDDGFDRMQREAIARAREMQRRAQVLPHQPAPETAKEPQKQETHSAAQFTQKDHEHSPPGGLLGGLLGSDFKIDEEKALIGMLIYILYKNGADVKLMLALGYLLL